MKYSIENSKVIFDNKTILDFEFEIFDHMEYQSVLIVVISFPESNPNYSRNAFGIDLVNAKIIWQIEMNEKIKNEFATIYINSFDNSKICLTGSPGVEFNPFNGKIIEVYPWFK